MKAGSANLLSVIKGSKQFVIPIYQRTYSWYQAQCEQLFKDILRISQSDNIHGHFVGSVVYFQQSIHTVFDKAILEQRLHQVMINARLSLDNKNERWLYDGNYG